LMFGDLVKSAVRQIRVRKVHPEVPAGIVHRLERDAVGVFPISIAIGPRTSASILSASQLPSPSTSKFLHRVCRPLFRVSIVAATGAGARLPNLDI
jgi:hypothetical protein